MPDIPEIPLIFIPPRYTTDDFTSNDTPSGVLTYIPFFEPWFRLVTGESLNKLVTAINELILRLNLEGLQRIVTAPGDVTVELGDYQILLNKTVPQATSVFLPAVSDWVDNGYNFAPLIIKDLANNASSNAITVVPAGTDKIDKLAGWSIAADGASLALRALNDKTGWYVA